MVKEFIYLGLKIDSEISEFDHIYEKFNKSEKCYYSLYRFGMTQNGLHPYTKAHIYNTYCLPKTT